jgi:non-ribosomal peptide synthetase-like protein
VLSRAVLGTTVSDVLGTIAIVLLDVVFTVAFFVLVERAITGFRRMRPRFCSIYQLPFWRHERYWKVPSMAYLGMFNGTPFKSVVWRLLGVRVGRRLLDDGCTIVERTLVTIGSECTLDVGSILQCHSLEGGTFKSDRITVGDRCTIGTGAFVHYGVTLGDGAVLDADSFLMKGEHVPPGARWRGNPAAAVPAGSTAPRLVPTGQPASHPPPSGRRPSHPPSPQLTAPRSPARARSRPS